jgi:MFS transporter, SP family, solute carrier family 2 (myo-inositol transporter), member 13
MKEKFMQKAIGLSLSNEQKLSEIGVFLATVDKYGYGTKFFAFVGCTVVYFITVVFFLPETKGKTLKEIEEHFEGGK